MSASSGSLSAATNQGLANASESASTGWSLAHRIVFRFASIYIFLCVFPFPFSVSVSGNPGNRYDAMWYAISRWAAVHILRRPRGWADVPADFPVFSFADVRWSYVQVFCYLLLAVLAAIVWSVLDRRRTEYRTLHEYLRIYVRYMLAFVMLGYGMDKVLLLQFNWALPDPSHLAEPLGNYTPFQLMWVYMGYSSAYTIFAGSLEVIGGALLFWRRTTTLGALFLCGVLANVVTLNFAYDVPVKLYSSTLLLLAIFLVVPEIGRLFKFFVQNRPAPVARIESPLRRPWMRIPAIVLKTAMILFAAYWYSGPAFSFQHDRGNPPRSPLYGLYQVESFTQSGQQIPLADSNWRRVIFQAKQYVQILTMDDSEDGLDTDYDVAKSTLTIADSHGKFVMSYAHPDADHLELRGDFHGQPTVIQLRKIDISKMPLLRERFHWNRPFE
jgi:multidrug transporter EmrE-like cation transporter